MSGDGAKQQEKPKRQRQFRTKRTEEEEEAPSTSQGDGTQEAPELQREKLEEMRLLQRLRKRVGGTTADALAQAEVADGLGLDKDEEEEPGGRSTELMGGFSKAQAVVTHEEDPNMQAFVEAELARRLGKRLDGGAAEDPEVKRQREEADMYKIPEEYKSSLVGDTVVPGTAVIITEVPLSAAVRLRNIEAVEDMKKRMLTGGRDDDRSAAPAATTKRKQFVESFGRQKKVDLSREQLEEQHKRMKYVSERRPAVPLHKAGNK